MNLLCLRGIARDQRTWGEFPERLRVHAPHLKVWTLDLPGVGTECERECPDTIAGMRIDLAKRFHEAVARGKLPAGPWSVLATSLGAMIAMDWAAAEPSLFKNVFVINTSASDVGTAGERFPFRFIPAYAHALLRFSPERLERLMLRLNSNRHHEMGHVLERQIAWRKERPITRRNLLRQLFSGARFELPSRLEARVFVLCSDGDRMVSSKISERIASRLGAPRFTHPWAGHDIAIDDPEWLSRRVAEQLPDPDAPKVAFRS